MKANMGSADKAIRIALACVFVALYLLNIVSGTIGILLVGFSLIFVATSMMSFCPLYMPFGFSTRRIKSEEE